MVRNASFIAAALLAGTANVASAAVVTGTISGGTARTAGGVFLNIAAPAAVGFDNFNDNNLRAFNEKQNITLTSALTLNSAAPAGSTTVAAGQVVSSHLIVFDPAGNQTDAFQPTVAGYVDFSTPVLGVIWRGVSLAATQSLLGATGTTYLNPTGFGLEQGSDFFTIAPLGNTTRVTINFFTATSPGDTLRVITRGKAVVNAVPEPATWLSMMLGFGIVGAFLRRRARRTATA